MNLIVTDKRELRRKKIYNKRIISTTGMNVFEILTRHNKEKHEIWEVIMHTHFKELQGEFKKKEELKEVSLLSEAVLVVRIGLLMVRLDNSHVQVCPR